MTETKWITTPYAFKADGPEGTIEAVFSTFNVVDRGGDVVLPGAIPDGKALPMVWSHDWTQIIGKGVTRIEPERAIFSGQLFLDTPAGEAAYRTMKNMGDMMQYSWGFMPIDTMPMEVNGETVRAIKLTEPFEVSPVLVGEGIGTHTLSLKDGRTLVDNEQAVLATVDGVVKRWQALAASLLKEGRTISESRRTRMGGIADQLEAASADLRAILKETEPQKAIDGVALWHAFLVTEARLNGVQVG